MRHDGRENEASKSGQQIRRAMPSHAKSGKRGIARLRRASASIRASKDGRRARQRVRDG
jgi:hypothetical protein